MKLLKTSESKRYLMNTDGEPFFYLGDTAWELFHKMSREEAEIYLQNRAENRFNVIQAVALAELDGLERPNFYGRKPLLQNQFGEYDPTLPDVSETEYDYWKHVDFIIEQAEELGLYIGLLPTWGDKYNRCWGSGPVIFTPENAFVYGRWLAERYRKRSNIIWILGGDRPLENEFHNAVIDQMAAGIRAGDQHKFLMTFHPCGESSSSQYVHNKEWLDFNMMQSGHGAKHVESYHMILHDRELFPIKPVLDGEPCYEDHPIGFEAKNGYFDAFDVRNKLYWNAFSGACGNVYGHHSIWSVNHNHEEKPSDYIIMDWKSALERPGGHDVRIFMQLQQEYSALACVPCPSLVKNNNGGANFTAACQCSNYALVYIPNGLRVALSPNLVLGFSCAHYFDVRTGCHFPHFGVPQNGAFVPPSAGRNNDWVLILE